MSIEEQVVVVYCGVRGHLDKIDPSKITKFEEQFMAKMKGAHQDVLQEIAAKNLITEETDAKLKKIVSEFAESFKG